ncbi:MAG TPA: multiheme c-type cytochrome [Polyangiaceae bacterium]
MIRRSTAVVLAALLGCSRRPPVADSDADAARGAAPEAAAAVAETPPDLALVYSSDLRGRVGGLARRATLVDQARIAIRLVLQVDAGDFLPAATDDSGDGGSSLERRTDLMLASYKRLGIDVVTVGERELALTPERLRTALHAANLSVVAANVVGKGGRLVFPADQLIESGDRAVGVFGILEVAGESAVWERHGLATTDAAEAARTASESLRARGAQLVVGLFHVAGGLARAREILAQIPEIDVVVLGHGERRNDAGVSERAGRTRVLYAGDSGARMGRLDVRFAPADGGIRLDAQTIPLLETVKNQLGMSLLPQLEDARARIAEEAAARAERRKKGQKEPIAYESWTYSSTAACALCHDEQTRQWKTTDHAQALASLQKGKHDRDPACLGCHTTAYLLPGGTRSLDTAIKSFPDVGCECCHGPSAEHVRSVNKKKGTSRKVDPTTCLGCHTPDQDFVGFDVAAALKSVLGPGHGAAAL